MIFWRLAARVCSGNLVNIVSLKQGTQLTAPMVAGSGGFALVESGESAVLVSTDKDATALILSTTCWGVKAASVPWVIRRAEKAEAMVESNMIIAR